MTRWQALVWVRIRTEQILDEELIRQNVRQVLIDLESLVAAFR
jgi:hypothetical protein